MSKGIAVTVTIPMRVELTEDDVSDILSGACEGGINYWCTGLEFKDISGKQDRTLDRYYVLTRRGIVEMLEDDEEGGGEWHTLTRDKLVSGIAWHMQVSERFAIEDWDANDYDRVIQYALFHEIRYS